MKFFKRKITWRGRGKNLIASIVLAVALVIGGCAGLNLDLTTGNLGQEINIDDAKAVYKTGRMVGLAMGFESPGIAAEAIEIAGKVLIADPDYFTDILLEEILLFADEEITENSRVYIYVIEFAQIIGFDQIDNILGNGSYEGLVMFKAVKWFAKGVVDGIERSRGNSVPYPDDWTIYDPENPEDAAKAVRATAREIR
jgi:hypothetical protein